MYDFEIEVRESLLNDAPALNNYIVPLMKYLDEAGDVERASRWNSVLGISKITFANNDMDHFVMFVTENELQINIHAYIQDIEPSTQSFIDALQAETIHFAFGLMDTKSELLEEKAAKFWVEGSFPSLLNIDHCITLDEAIQEQQRIEPWKTKVLGADIDLWISDPDYLAPGSENVYFTPLTQTEGMHYHNLLKPVLAELFSNPHLAAWLPHTRLSTIVLTKDLRDGEGDECHGITIVPDTEGPLSWQTIFFDIEDFSTGAAYRIFFHETMHTWANTFPEAFWLDWNRIHGSDHPYSGSLKRSEEITGQKHQCAILGFDQHIGVTSPLGLNVDIEDVPELLRTLMSEAGRELVCRRCGADAVTYDQNGGPDLVMKAKVLKLMDMIRMQFPREAFEIEQTVFREHDLARTKQGQRIFLMQADTSMTTYLACDKLAAQLIREGATVTHLSPRRLRPNTQIRTLETLLGSDPRPGFVMDRNTYLYFVGDLSNYMDATEYLITSHLAEVRWIQIMPDAVGNVRVLNRELESPMAMSRNCSLIVRRLSSKVNNIDIVKPIADGL
eukprot:GEMP01010995.1.p1 GENE.GEMP01010995.1~~GEMP01010995.1.p1  ORF type:complete len:559 (+),score=89.78 GEMP01010995.1:694-2370(+)